MPPISGTDESVMYSLAGVARAGLVRAGTHSAKVFVKINGTQRAYNRPSSDSRVTPESLKIKRSNGATPDTATCTVMGFVPGRLQEIEINLGSVNRLRHLFAGHILSSKQRYLVDTAQIAYDLGCIDYAWELNALVTGHFTGTGDAIATEWIATYAPHFSAAKIQPDLPLIEGGISCTNVPLRTAFDRLVERFGGKWKSDYRRRILLGTSDYAGLTNPRTITGPEKTFLFDPDAFYVLRDVSQRLTRMHFEGMGFEALAEIAAGETILPLTAAPASVYGDVGGEVIIGDSQQIISYAARVEGGGGSLVGPGAQPSSAPTLDYGAGSGVTDGEHDVTVVFVTGTGRSKPSPFATITSGVVPPPTTAPTAATPTPGGSVTAGAHYVAMTEVTAAGETTPSPVSATVTAVAGISAPSVSASTNYGSSDLGDNTTGFSAGNYKWGYTFVNDANPLRETTLVAWSGAAFVADPVGHPNEFVAITTNSLSAPPVGWSRRWYRTEANGSTYKRVPTGTTVITSGGIAFPQGVETTNAFGATSMCDYAADAQLGAAAPAADMSGLRTIVVSTLELPTSALVTDRKLYMTEADQTQLKLVAAIGITATGYIITIADGSLGANAPTSNTAVAAQIAARSIPIGNSDVTARELYMSPAGGGARKRALTISDNTTTTGTITMSDATLAGQLDEPTVDTSGLTQPSGTINPGATEVVVAGLAPFRAEGGWAYTGTQAFRYTGFTGAALTGIPATGPGSIQQALSYNTVIAAAPSLVGVPSGSPSTGSITNTIQKGSAVNLWVTVDNLAAQAFVQNALDPNNASNGLAGIIADVISDSRVGRDEAIARATSKLDTQDDEDVTVGYSTLDLNAEAGRTQVFDLPTPLSVSETLVIQDEEVSWIDSDPPTFPVHTNTASSRRYTFEELLRKSRENR